VVVSSPPHQHPLTVALKLRRIKQLTEQKRLANKPYADFIGADFIGTKLYKANLNEVTLCGVDLSGTDLSEVYISTTNLKGTNIKQAIFYKTLTPWNENNSDF